MRTWRGSSLQGLHQHLVPQYLVPVRETRPRLIGYSGEKACYNTGVHGMMASVPLVDGHLIDGDDVAMATLRAKQASVRAVVRKLWSQHCCRVDLPVLILVRNPLKCYLYASMCFGYTGSLLLV